MTAHDHAERFVQLESRIAHVRERQAAIRASRARRRRLRVLAVAAGVLIAGTLGYVVYGMLSTQQMLLRVGGQLDRVQDGVTASRKAWEDAAQELRNNEQAFRMTQEQLTRFRAETRTAMLLQTVDGYLDELKEEGRVEFHGPGEKRELARKLRAIIQPSIVRELTENPDIADAQMARRMERLVVEHLNDVVDR
ncbi:MAG TPA: hypothetical protein VGF59_09555 [Bryobacteraceae bacterium]